MLRECVLLVSVCVLGAGSFSGRGFFCRDPDTGKLHAVNTTWPATSFCGNYHCRLRRKNLTSTEYAPLRQLNVTNIKILGHNITVEGLKNETIFLTADQVAKKIGTVSKKTEPDIIDGILPLDSMGVKVEDSIENQNETEKDRYLSDKEIRSLTEILHTVKKSDLDAIVEIYNLAQDIYKEIDKTSTDHVLDEAMYTAKTVTSNLRTKSDTKKNGHVSYWYEPLSNNKVRPAELLRGEMARAETLRNDMNAEMPVPAVIPVAPAPAVVLSVARKPHRRPQPVTAPKPVSMPPVNNQMRKITDTFFTGPLSRKDFGKLPYYYPLSNFQRMSSYVHQQKPTKMASSKSLVAKSTYKTATFKPPHSNSMYLKGIQPSVLLPYPFSNIHHYNWSYPQNSYHKNNRFEKANTNRKEQVNTARKHLQKPNNVVLMNPDLENFQDLEIRPSKKEEKTMILHKEKEERRRPNWQTDALPKQLLDEVRAHIQEKQKVFIHPLPLRKRIKLERVGKVIKLEEAVRSRRSVEVDAAVEDDTLEPQLFEVYIERTTCNSDYSVPGYFRYGNLSQPYPDCCPQRISTR